MLTDSQGTSHTYTKKSEGGYTAPPGEAGVLTKDSAGAFTLTDEAGTVYTFDTAGKVTAVTQVQDGKKRASPIYVYRSGSELLDSIQDPLDTANHRIRFAYSGDTAAALALSPSDTDVSGKACPVPAGYSPAPAGMICRIVYPGHVAGAADTTQLLYQALNVGSGSRPDDTAGGTQLSTILDPGNERTDFQYANGSIGKDPREPRKRLACRGRNTKRERPRHNGPRLRQPKPTDQSHFARTRRNHRLDAAQQDLHLRHKLHLR